MTEDWKLFVALAVIVAVVFLISRYPAVLTALLGRATARCRDAKMLRRLDYKNLSQIAAEWDALAPLRYQQITSGIDISYNRVIAPALLQLLNGDADLSSTLDVGCGTGIFTKKISELTNEMVGIDPSKKSIEIAKSLRLNRATFVQTTAEDYSRKQVSAFTAIIANMVFMDVLKLDDFLAACKRMLASEGMLVFSMTHPCFWPEYYGYSNEEWFDYQKEIIIESPFRISADRIGSLVSTHVHRPLAAYFSAFSRHGFFVEKIAEPSPPDDVSQTYKAGWRFPRYMIGSLKPRHPV